MIWHKPQPLSLGDRVRVVAPSGPFDRATFERGFSLIANRYQATYDEGIFSAHRYLAGDDARRITELNAAFADSSVKGIFYARGGYGSMRLLSSLNLSRRPPPVVVGFSDATAVHLALQTRGVVSVHGPVLTQLGNQPPEVHERFFRVLEGRPLEALSGSKTFIPSTVEGPLVGGNMALLAQLIGTPFFPDLTGAILLIEDISETPYRLDCMWTHLRLSGQLSKVAGIALGDFTDCEQANANYSSVEVLSSLVAELGVPCAGFFPIGHGKINMTVPLGCRVRLDANAQRLEFLETLGGQVA